MRAVIQRVSSADVTINGVENRNISLGLVVLLAIENTDNQDDVTWLVNKLINMRIFDNEEGIMDLSLIDTSSDIMIISQFTLYASTRKGNRPSYIRSSKPEIAKPIYHLFIQSVNVAVGINSKVVTGEFGADMKVHLLNDGPVTIIVDSKIKE
jgi:D-tyrosyl-tRNA(Tyr) deacylase